MKTKISFIVLCLTIICTLSCNNSKSTDEIKKTAAQYLDYGVLKDSVYTNKFFGINIPISKDFMVLSKNNAIKQSKNTDTLSQKNTTKGIRISALETEVLLQIGEKIPELDDVLKDSSKLRKYLFKGTTTKNALGTSTQINGYMFVMASNISNLNLKTTESYVDDLNEGYVFNQNKDREKRKIDGIDFYTIKWSKIPRDFESGNLKILNEVHSTFTGKKKSAIGFVTEINGVVLSIFIMYYLDEQKDMFLDILDNITIEDTRKQISDFISK